MAIIDAKQAKRARSEMHEFGRHVRAIVQEENGQLLQVTLVDITKVRGKDAWIGTELGTGADRSVVEVFY